MSLGISQDLTLNAAGDRQLASHDFKRVEPGPSCAEWRRVAQMIVWPGTTEAEVKYGEG